MNVQIGFLRALTRELPPGGSMLPANWGDAMDAIEFLRDNWGLIRGNPWVFIACAFLSGAIGWGLRGLLAKGGADPIVPARARFRYADTRRHGPNVLGAALDAVKLGTPISMRAEVPRGKTLRVRLIGPLPQYVEDTHPAWTIDVSKVNWTAEKYLDDLDGHQPTQTFFAEVGLADLKLYPGRIGTISIQAFEDGSRSASWEKSVRVTQ